MKLFLVRHGETDWNKELRYQGQRDTDLNRNGVEQAERAAFLLKEESPDSIYTSDLKRAYRTASIIGRVLNLHPQKDKRLREIDFGSWEGKTYEEVVKLYPEEVAVWRQEPLKAVLTGGERLNDVLDRVLQAVEVICRSNNNAVVVTHGGPIRLLLLHMQVEDSMWHYPVKPGSVTVIRYGQGGMELVGQRGG